MEAHNPMAKLPLFNQPKYVKPFYLSDGMDPRMGK